MLPIMEINYMEVNSMETETLPAYLPSLGRLLGFASHSVSVLTQGLLDEHGLALTHWVILTALWRKDGLLVSEIGEYYRVKGPAASRAVDRMVAKQLIERRTDPKDRRVARVFLTAKSRKLAHLLTLYDKVNAELLRDFSPEEAQSLFKMLERVNANAKAATPERD